jgi:BCD family chlorophyll transporter-like MFS transporter
MIRVSAPSQGLGWVGIVRLGLVQTALGAVIVLLTSTINRVMVVELALPAVVPGLLIAIHYAVQVLRPAWGYGSDVGGKRTPWIIGGMAVLCVGAIGAAYSTYWTSFSAGYGLAAAAVSFLLVGMGVGAAGTSLLTLLATRVAPQRRAAAATTVWVMMIMGFVISAPLAGHFLDPYSHERLVLVTSCVAAIAFVVAVLAVHGIERASAGDSIKAGTTPEKEKRPFREVLAEVWGEPDARRFTIFIFMSMLAYSTQDLILEPFAGLVFGLSPGATTKIAGLQHAGVLVGMIGVSIAASVIGGRILGSLRLWTVTGCIGSALSLLCIAASGHVGPEFPLRAAIFALGVANGGFAVAAIGTMMALANAGNGSQQGTRMGLWGAGQGVAFGLGGFLGTVAVDAARYAVGDPLRAFTIVFVAEAIMFIVSATMAARIDAPQKREAESNGLVAAGV